MTDDHQLARSTAIKRLWIVFITLLALTVFAEFWISGEPHFEIERLFGFNALFGFLACAAMIILAKGLALLLKRTDDYYAERADD